MNHKRFVLAAGAAALSVVLCACGGEPQGSSPAADSPSPAVSEPVSGAPASSAPAETDSPAPESPSPSQDAAPESSAPAVSDDKDTAVSLIGSSVEDLYAAIGEPSGSDYAPSCMGSGEDGELFYDGFTVYTYREGNTETVEDVL